MTIIYVVGPTGAGKSELCSRVSDNRHFHHRDIDSLLKKRHNITRASDLAEWHGWHYFWEKYLELIQEYETEFALSNSVGLIDVGSGILRDQEACEYFIEHHQQTIFVWVPSDVYRARRGEVEPSTGEIEQYGLWPTQLREATRYCIDTSVGDISASVSVFQKALESIISQAED